MKKLMLTLLICVMIFPLLAQEDLSPVFPYAENGKWGAIDKTGKVVIKPKYKEISLFTRNDKRDALAKVTSEEGLQGAVKRNGKLAAKIRYGFIDLYGNGEYLIVKNPEGRYGLVKTQNRKELLKTEYKSISRFKGGKLGVSIINKDGKYGAINENGKIIAEPIYKEARLKDAYKDYPDVKLTREDGSAFVMDCWGDPVKKTAGGSMEDEDLIFEDMMIEEAEAGPPPPKSTTRMIEIDGRQCLEFTTTYTNYQRKRTEVKDTIAGIDQVIKVYHRYYSDKGYGVDYVIAQKEGKTGIINNNGEILTPFEYDMVTEKGGRNYFELIKGDKKGAASRQGELLFDARFEAMKLKNYSPVFWVKTGNFEGYADKDGHVYLPKKAFEQ